MSENGTILEVRNATKVFELRSGTAFRKLKLYALDGVNLKVRKGETLGIIGESGCGKSTLSRCIVSLHDLTEGAITFKGEDIAMLHDKARKQLCRGIQMIFQDPYSSLNPRRTVEQAILEPMVIHNIGGSYNERVKFAAKLAGDVGINEHHLRRYPHEFSGGQRQRINIARALVLNPEILVCDEPVSALDVSMQAQILNLFIALQKEYALTYVFISHDLSVIRYVSDTIAVMYLGHIVELGRAAEIYDKPLHPYTKALLSAIPPGSPFKRMSPVELKGEIPSPIGRRKGCSLAERCPLRTDRCVSEVPKLRKVSGDHHIACFLYKSLEDEFVNEKNEVH
jgi:oligopeptide/dipeptide ABC transporter ATP-binding protein